MITREEALKWLRNHPEETGDGFYMASAIVDLHDENATILANAQRIAAQYAAERDNLTALLRLAEASVSLLRGDVDRASLEIRRLRAAEAPGTDDEAVAPWVWRDYPGEGYFWQHPEGPRVSRIWTGWRRSNSLESERFRLALDAMRAAVPGSV